MLLTDLATLLLHAVPVDASWYAPLTVNEQTVPQARAPLAESTVAVATLTSNGHAKFRTTSMGAVALVYRLTDAYPSLPPPPDTPVPSGALLTTACVSSGIVLLGSWLLHGVLDRIPPSQLLRTWPMTADERVGCATSARHTRR